MPSDYKSIRETNKADYGRKIGSIGQMLLADRYDDRTHFIYELLQNAEDALARRTNWQGQRNVCFDLHQDRLTFKHYGKPFDHRDVLGICGIAEGNKELTDIGRFGIGFKSVYSFTSRPEIHSGEEDFAIETYVLPVASSSVPRHSEETIIDIPFKSNDPKDLSDITCGLQRLGPEALLFLRHINAIEWRVENGPSGTYRRIGRKDLAKGVCQVTVIAEESGKPTVENIWLVFSKPLADQNGRSPGAVEIAFRIIKDIETNQEKVVAVSRSQLVVFFPTAIVTDLGFLIQGPYRTTPSRDNIPRQDSWNIHCLSETALLLTSALNWLRDNNLLDIDALNCLPLDPKNFAEGSLLFPLFEETRRALSVEPLLPRHGGGFVSAQKARLARVQKLRELISPSLLGTLLEAQEDFSWLSGDISQDRTPVLWNYLTSELQIAEISPEAVVRRLSKPILDAQSDPWIERLNEFLEGQPSLLRKLAEVPIVRLEDGSHVLPKNNDKLLAYLPGKALTGFPTVRKAVCSSDSARKFLMSLGLSEPDIVDDVVRNILPLYEKSPPDLGNYSSHIHQILTAFGTDSAEQRELLVKELKNATFVMAVDAASGKKSLARPTDVYQSTELLKGLFAGVEGILLVDEEFSCLQGEDISRLLSECGTTPHLQPVNFTPDMPPEEEREIRRKTGLEKATYSAAQDKSLRGVDRLLTSLKLLPSVQRGNKIEQLWKALLDLECQCGSEAFSGTLKWCYGQSFKQATFPASFVNMLNACEWVPDVDGNLHRPDSILFDSLGWEPSPFLQSMIHFMPQVLQRLAMETGIDPDVLTLIKDLGLTKEQLLAFLGKDKAPANKDKSPQGLAKPQADLQGNSLIPEPTPMSSLPKNQTDIPGSSPVHKSDQPHDSRNGQKNKQAQKKNEAQDGHDSNAKTTGNKRTPGSVGGKPFISYVGTHPDEEEEDPDGLDQATRMSIEAMAIDRILASEPTLHRTPPNNPGFDLCEETPDGKIIRYCEVKAMTGSLKDRPVAISRTQFEYALMHGPKFWLYVVEHARDDNPRIVKIQDPFGKARQFTFDCGWLDVAEPEA